MNEAQANYTEEDFAMSYEPFRVDRRALVAQLTAAGVSASAIAAMTAPSTLAQSATPEATDALTAIGKSESLIIHGDTTFETPLEAYSEFLTPNDKFFVRSNGPVTMDIDPAEWRLTVSGLVDNELELSLDDLQAMDPVTVTAFLECSGNSRSRFPDDPQTIEGTRWGNGAIGNAEWTGVPLSRVLEEAGVQEGAVDIVSQGADFEDMQRGLPIDVATNGEVMLVWQMNGEDLPAPNGGPVRLLVPRWGGIASTKWVESIEVIDHTFDGYFNVESYIIIDENGEVLRPVEVMPVKSMISSVAPGEELTAGAQTVSGIAWSGEGVVTKVEVSTDNGETWEEASITEEAGATSWARFEFEWDAAAGETTLLSRATDETGNTQPDSIDDLQWNVKGYQMNAVYPVDVTVA